MLTPALILLGSALAAPLHVGADVLLWTDRDPIRGQVLLTPTGLPRVLITTYRFGWRTDLALPTAEGWALRPAPDGVFAMGPEDLVLLPGARSTLSGRMALVGDQWVSTPGSRLPELASGPAAIGRDGRVRVYGWEGTGPAVFSEQADGSWKPSRAPESPLAVWAEGGELWWLGDNGITGPRMLRRNIGGLPGIPTGGLDRSGAPALAVVERGRLVVQHRAGTASTALPREITLPAEERCVTTPCPTRSSYAAFASGGGIAATASDLWLPYVRITISEDVTCRPFEGEMHPCDPAGPINTCPERPAWTCGGPERRAYELRLASARGTTMTDVALADLPGGAEVAASAGDIYVWDIAADARGSLHLLVDTTSDDHKHNLYYVRLDPGPVAPSQSSTLLSPPPVSLDQLSEESLGLAGWITQSGVRPGDRPPGFQDGEAISGGEQGAGWWSVPLVARGERPARLEVSLSLDAPPSCGVPELQLLRGNAQLRAQLRPEGLLVTVNTTGLSQTLPLSGPDHRIRLEMDARAATVTLDEGAPARLELGVQGYDSGDGYALFGDLAGCQPLPATRVRWRSVRLD